MNAKTLIALILLTITGAAHAATTVEVAAGIADATPRGNGIWYQKGFPYRMQRQAPAVSIGLRADVTEHVALHGGLYSMGQSRIDAQAVTNDALYVHNSPTHCPGVCPPTARFITRGSVYGARLLAEWHTGGAWDLGVMAGPIFYHVDWHLAAPDWFPTAPAGAGYTRGPVMPIYLHYSRWNLGQALGTRLTHGRQFIELMLYRDGVSFATERNTQWSHHVALTYGLSF